LKILKGLTPYEAICKSWTTEPQRFNLNPIHQMPGLNIWLAGLPAGRVRGLARQRSDPDACHPGVQCIGPSNQSLVHTTSGRHRSRSARPGVNTLA
jgi:hypothetical protein